MLVGVQIPDDRQQQLAELLKRAFDAHRQYEAVVLKRPDQNWARWVAGFVLERGIGKELAREMTEVQLADWLARFDRDYRASDGSRSQQDYLADRLWEAAWPEPAA